MDNFDSVSSDTISDSILQALNFYFFFLGYLEEKTLQFVDIIDNLNLPIEPIDNS